MFCIAEEYMVTLRYIKHYNVMTLEALSQKKSVLLGLLQFLGGFAYIALVATFFQLMNFEDRQPPEFLAALLMMTLLVFSASVMGTIFLGLPAYLALKGNWTKALKILGYTLLFVLGAITILGVATLFIVR